MSILVELRTVVKFDISDNDKSTDAQFVNLQLQQL